MKSVFREMRYTMIAIAIISALLPSCYAFGDDSLRIVSLVLVNSVNGSSIQTLTDGSVISLADLPSNKVNIRADVAGSGIQRVDFTYDRLRFRNETSTPYTLAGDKGGRYNAWLPSVGRHVLTVAATGKPGARGKGVKKAELTIRFTVVKESRARPTPAATRIVPPAPSPTARIEPSPTPFPEATRLDAVVPAETTGVPPVLLPTFHIACGGRGFVTEDGTVWQSDIFLTSAAAYGSSPSGTGLPMDALYKSGRNSSAGPVEFRIPVPAGDYRVTLHFMERYLTAPGKSVFNIFIEGREVARNLDLIARVGTGKPFSLTDQAQVTDGILHIELKAQQGLAAISGIEIAPRTVPPLVP